MHRTRLSAGQRGAALFTALIILVALTLLTLGSLGTSLLELRMAGNEEAQMSAFQSAQAAIENVIAIDTAAQDPLTPNLANQYFRLSGAVGDTNCTPSWPDACDQNTIVLEAPLESAAGEANQVQVTRLTDPINTRKNACLRAAIFTVESTFDQSAAGQGKSELVQGYVTCDHLQAPPTGGPPITGASSN